MRQTARTFASIRAAGPPAEPVVRSLGTAVVIGGSLAGLTAARVLAEHAERVLVVERDELPEGGGPRKGVPQSNQAHVLLAAGAEHLERWFPGFLDRICAAGACRIGGDQVQVWDDLVPRVNGSDVLRLSLTRPFLEELVRRELLAWSNVEVVHARVSGLRFDERAVTGVEPGISADFVVDASGRASKVGDWLEAAGWEKPPMQRVPSGVNYSSAFFRRRPDEPSRGLGMALTGTIRGGAASGAIFMPVEGERWLVVQGGYGDFRPGATNEDMIRRCRHDYPAPFGRVAQNEMIGDVATYRFPDNRRRDYWACRRMPARLVAVGDAAASFNPIYGQGISSAALQAAALSMYLSSAPDLNAPAREFFRLQKVVVDAAWSIATSGDSSVAGGQPLPRRAAGWVAGRVVGASMRDQEVNRIFVDVTQMLQHPSALTRPGVLARTLLGVGRRRPARVQPLL